MEKNFSKRQKRKYDEAFDADKKKKPYPDKVKLCSTPDNLSNYSARYLKPAKIEKDLKWRRSVERHLVNEKDADFYKQTYLKCKDKLKLGKMATLGRETGLSPHFSKKLLEYIIRKNRTFPFDLLDTMKRRKVFNSIRVDVLKSLFRRYDPRCLSLRKLRNLYYQQVPNASFGLETLRAVLKKKMRMIFSKPEIKHYSTFTKGHVRSISIYLHEMSQIIQEGGHIVYFDESKFYNQHNKKLIWVETGTDKFIRMPEQQKGFTLYFLCDSKGNYFYRIYSGREGEVKLLQFFQKFLKEVCDNTEIKLPYLQGKLWIVLDNNGIHNSLLLRQFFQQAKINVIFTATHSPQLNMAEYLFSHFKRKFYEQTFSNR